jgi:Tol biopolymer transport system component
LALTPGTRISVYQIAAQIGEGGMGQVLRARDTKLDRDVALKILPDAFAHDADRLARFQREAKTLASLNHPNIAAIYGIEESKGLTALVMELVEGDDLSQSIAKGAIPLDEALPIAKQIADALEAAHEQGIIHRDLKPANIKVRADGMVKVLDFGLAKAMEPTGAMSASVSMSPTLTTPAMTQAGMILGTAAYMSPEQARGLPVDHRADIFSFGCVVYEMLTGVKPFEGSSVSDVLAAVLKVEPDWTMLPADVTARLRDLVRRCLEKDRKRRWQAIGDVRFELESPERPVAAAVAAPARPRLWKTLVVAAVLGAVAVGGVILGRRTGAISQPSYQRLTFSRGTIWNARFAPDGQTVVYSARWNGNALDVFSGRAGKTASRSLKLDNTDVLAVSVSNEMAVLCNRQYIGNFISHGTLARMPVDGGAARDLLDDVQEADWSPDGTELAVVRWVHGQNQLEYPVGKVLYKSAGHLNHPRVSPKGDRVAFMDHPTQLNTRGWVAVVDLTGKKTVLSGEWSSEEGLAWAPAGDEVWFMANKSGEADALYAVTLSGRERLIVRMTNRLMLQDISRDGRVLLTSFTPSSTFISQPPGETRERDLSWLDPGFLTDFAPDGKTILFQYFGEGAGTNSAVYLRKTDGSPAVRLGDGNSPQLAPDGKWALAVLFTPPQLVLLPTGAGEVRRLERGPIEQYAFGAIWIPDGKRVAFLGREAGHDFRGYVQSIEGGPPRPVTPEGTTEGLFASPDGRLLIAADARGQRFSYSVDGGAPQPIAHLESADNIIGWSSDGRTLFIYRSQDMPLTFRVSRFDPATGRK